jgi:hypothetical protein
MVVDHTNKITLRPGRFDMTRIGWAFAVSIGAHLLFWGVYAANDRFDLGRKLNLPQWAQKLISPPPPPPPPVEREPYMFVHVSDAQAVGEPPKNTIRYSDRNAAAANPELVDAQSNEPKLDGENPESRQTETGSRRNPFDQLMPDPPKPVEPPPPKLTPGAMTVAQLQPQPPAERPRPRTLLDAKLQNEQRDRGARARLDGGTPLRARASYDVRATGFGAYDRAFVDAVSARWYHLLDNMSYDGYRQGKVVLQFVLNYDGRITEMKVVSNTVTESLSLLCQKAVLDPAPFERWPREMRLMVGEDSRRITFTFNYN